MAVRGAPWGARRGRCDVGRHSGRWLCHRARSSRVCRMFAASCVAGCALWAVHRGPSRREVALPSGEVVAGCLGVVVVGSQDVLLVGE